MSKTMTKLSLILALLFGVVSLSACGKKVDQHPFDAYTKTNEWLSENIKIETYISGDTYKDSSVYTLTNNSDQNIDKMPIALILKDAGDDLSAKIKENLKKFPIDKAVEGFGYAADKTPSLNLSINAHQTIYVASPHKIDLDERQLIFNPSGIVEEEKIAENGPFGSIDNYKNEVNQYFVDQETDNLIDITVTNAGESEYASAKTNTPLTKYAITNNKDREVKVNSRYFVSKTEKKAVPLFELREGYIHGKDTIQVPGNTTIELGSDVNVNDLFCCNAGFSFKLF